MMVSTLAEKYTIICSYLNMGLKVIPFDPNAKKPSRILEEHGGWAAFRDAPITSDMWHAWLIMQPNCNVGIITGRYSGYMVVDCDTEESVQWAENNLPYTTMWATSGSGVGRHYFYRKEGGDDIGNMKLLDNQIDIRSESGVLLVYPSKHPDTGNVYTWADEQQFPDVSSVPSYTAILPYMQSSSADVETIVDKNDWQYYFDNPEQVHKGSRNTMLTRIVGGLVQKGMKDPHMLAIILKQWYSQVADKKDSNPDVEINNAIASILKREVFSNTSVQQVAINPQNDIMPLSEFFLEYGGWDDVLEWDIVGWLPSGTTGLIVSPPANYKTWIMNAIAVAIATGKPFLGKFEVPKAQKVLVVQQEDAKSITAQKLRVICDTVQKDDFVWEWDEDTETLVYDIPPAPNVDIWVSPLHLKLDDPIIKSSLEMLISTHEYKVVFIDPLYLSVSIDNYMAAAAAEMGILKTLRDKYGCTFMLLHHTKKTAATDDISRLDAWGSQLLNAWIETGFQFRSTDNPNQIRAFVHFKNAPTNTSVKLMEFHINTDLSSDEYGFGVTILNADGHDPDDATLEVGTNQRILDSLAAHGAPMTISAIADDIEIGRSSVSRKMPSLLEQGLVSKTSSGLYILPNIIID